LGAEKTIDQVIIVLNNGYYITVGRCTLLTAIVGSHGQSSAIIFHVTEHFSY
jgi:hypothetical protein